MIRVSFNGGELSPQVQMRADLDVFARGCSVVENFDIDQAGGVSRRRGFRRFAQAQGGASRLFAHRYTNSEACLVEVGEWELRVYAADGGLLYRTSSPYAAVEIRALRTVQLNALLIFVCAAHEPMQLRCDADGAWSFEAMRFKYLPWRHSGLRDWPLRVLRVAGSEYEVEFPEAAEYREREILSADTLRVSYYTEAAEVKRSRAEVYAAVGAETYAEGFMSAESVFAEGTVFAVRRKPERIAYTVLAAWKGSEKFVAGLIDPANYKADFQEASEVPEDAEVVAELTKSDSFTKGEVFLFDSGYWDIFTCIQEFDGGEHFREDAVNPEDYPGHFVRGFMVGSAPCKGRWKLHLSGTWYGSYEVRACYEGTGAAGDDWEYRAEAWSRNAAPVNEPVAGDEGGEECYISLWLTRVRAYGEVLAERCFPADSCGNELVVCSYKHDMLLRAVPERTVVTPATAKTFFLTLRATSTTTLVSGWLYWTGPGGVQERAMVRVRGTESLPAVVTAINAVSSCCVAELVNPGCVGLRCSTLGTAGNAFSVTLGALSEVFSVRAEAGADAVTVVERNRFERVDRVQPPVSGVIESEDWSWCAWGQRYGYPRLAAIFNQRLVFCGTDAQPLTIWMSQTDDLDNFDITDEASSAMALTVAAQTQDPIRWLVVSRGRIMLGTSEGEYVAQSGDGGVLTNANAVVGAHGYNGSAAVAAICGCDRIIYFERGGGRVMQYGYDQQQDAYISEDLTVYAEHVLPEGGGVVEGCFLRKPNTRAVIVMANGQLALMTYNAHHRVHAWHRYVTEGRFLSVTMLPNGDRADRLFAVVERQGSYAIEVMDSESPYQDAGGLDYTSTLLTNALSVTRLGAAKSASAELWLYLHEPCQVKGVELTVDGGGTWSRVPRQVTKVLERGWHKLCAVPNVGMERCVGFRCHGNRGLQVGALQA